jgi:ABC transport system ATP-binding/permease protein
MKPTKFSKKNCKREAEVEQSSSDIDAFSFSDMGPPPTIIQLLEKLNEKMDSTIKIGSNKKNDDIIIPLITIAPSHVSFKLEDGQVVIIDKKDHYPTYVEDELLEGSKVLEDGEKLRIGWITYVFKDGILKLQKDNEGAEVNLKNLSFGYKKKQKKEALLKKLTNTIKSGESVVIRGESGCGKSTLLKFIADQMEPGSFWSNHKEKKDKGERTVLLNNGTNKKPIVAYVSQSPVLPNGLTVDELFRLFANLYNIKEEEAEIKYILYAMQLKSKRNNKVKDLSGGEQRRVHVGLELLRKPNLILLDEPDSSLDKLNRQITLSLLDALKHSGVTVIATSHSPEITSFFDREIDLYNNKQDVYED